MTCAICRRDTGSDPVVPDWLLPWRDLTVRTCSIVCLSLISLRTKPMIDPTEHEVVALETASDRAGEYLESLGKSDLASLSRDEWMAFLEVVVTGWTDSLRELECAQPAG